MLRGDFHPLNLPWVFIATMSKLHLGRAKFSVNFQLQLRSCSFKHISSTCLLKLLFKHCSVSFLGNFSLASLSSLLETRLGFFICKVVGGKVENWAKRIKVASDIIFPLVYLQSVIPGFEGHSSTNSGQQKRQFQSRTKACPWLRFPVLCLSNYKSKFTCAWRTDA